MIEIKVKQIRCVLIDIDGTLIDSNDAHAHAWQEAMKETGYTVDYMAIRLCVGMGSDKLLVNTVSLDQSSSLGKQIVERHDVLFEETFLPHLKTFPMVRPLR